MEPDLRGPLVECVERLATDLTVGRHGDPYMAFTVLLHPDRPPTILSLLAGHPSIEMTRLRRGGDTCGQGVPFPVSEFEEATHAMADARLGLIMSSWDRADKRTAQPGATIGEQISKGWERRRLAPIERELQQAEYEAAHPAICDQCRRRFTARGLPMHLSRSWCGQAIRDAELREQGIDPDALCRRCPESRRSHGPDGNCLAPACGCPGFDGRDDHA